ncbi:MAG TPA: ROK family protein [Microbacterium sp.]|nr:ROK family protein [Microbacterium sp.]
MAILNLVRSGRAVTRPELEQGTGLSRAMVAQRVDQLIELGLLSEGELGASRGGRAPRTIRFNSERGIILVAAFGARHIRTGISDLSGRFLTRLHTDWNIADGPGRSLGRAVEMLAELHAGLVERAPVWGLGIGVPGPVDAQTGQLVAPPNMPGWDGVDARATLADEWDAPAWVDTDVNLLAQSQRAVRAAEGVENLLYLKMGTGIGAAVIGEGRLLRGATGAAGNIGHAAFGGSDIRCRCGKTGCLEAVASGWALGAEAERRARAGEGPLLQKILAETGEVSPLDLATAARDGDSVAIELIQRSAKFAGHALAILVDTVNPSHVVIGGALSTSGELFLASIRSSVYEKSLPLATRDLVITRSPADEFEPLRGGSVMVQQGLFEQTFLNWFQSGSPVAK